MPTSNPTIVWAEAELLHCSMAQPPSLSSLVIPGAELCTRAQCPRRPTLNWLNSLSQDPCTSSSSHGEDTCSKQLLHIPDGRARQMSKENQRERQGKVYEPAFANLNETLSIPSSKTGCSWRNSRPWPVRGCPGSPTLSTATTQRTDNISRLLAALRLNHDHSGTSTGRLWLRGRRNR
ncbi:unnamed protein product [Pleuronectes platessa]|uniref:Uncharacterized protein n=1 Tax=Pleuronectes platessa TaxID=8262 RepID=A0A9N7W495_PLEPL|nr:unnamed protein product [Pleuronectes platessa]